MSLKGSQLEFGPFRVDTANQLLLYGDKHIPLAPKAYDTLLYLLENPNRLITRDELMKAVWPDSFVEDGNVSVNIFQLRKVLGEMEDGPRYIETVPRRGYRFSTEVKVIEAGASSSGATTPTVILASTEALRVEPRMGERIGSERTYPPPARGAGLHAEATVRQAALSEVITFPEAQRPERGSPEGPLQSIKASAGAREGKSNWIAGRRWALLGALGLVVLGLLVGWFLWHRTKTSAQITERRLTSFAPEMAVTASAISTGGKFIAYANPAGLFVQVISTGETHTLALPESGFDVSGISWFPDSANLLVGGSDPGDASSSLWNVPVIGSSAPVKLGSYPSGAVSPDGDEIAWVDGAGEAPTVQIMRSDGGDVHTVVTGSAGETFGSVRWYASGQRILFVRYRWDPQFRRSSGSIDFYDLKSGKTATVISGAGFGGGAVSLRNGKIVYIMTPTANPVSNGCNLMEVETDPQTGRAAGAPVVLAKWDAPVTGLSTGASGRRLVMRDLIVEHEIYMANLKDHGSSVGSVRRLSFGIGREDFAEAWTPDGRAVFLDTNRNGNWQIFKRALDGKSATPFVDGPDDQFSPRVSPDGNWLLYLERPKNWREPEPVSLMRVPISGGLPQLVLKGSYISEWGLRFECPRHAGRPCLLAGRQGNQVTFRPFDPAKGLEPSARGATVQSVGNDFDWALAPDGSRLAWINRNPSQASIHVLRFESGPNGFRTTSQHVVSIKGWSQLRAISWAPNGEGWFLVSSTVGGWKMLRVDPQGKPSVLLKSSSDWPPDVEPSPDGRRLAFAKQSFGSNVWILQNF